MRATAWGLMVLGGCILAGIGISKILRGYHTENDEQFLLGGVLIIVGFFLVGWLIKGIAKDL